MATESGTYISDFDITNPADNAAATELDDHLRLIKSFLKATFPGTGGDLYDEPVTATSDQIDGWDARLTALEGLSLAQVSPVAGRVDTTGVSSGTITVSGVGFQPKMIWIWGSGDAGPGESGFSFAAWHEDHDNGYPTSFSANPASNFAESRNLVSFAFVQYANSGNTSDVLSIDSVGSDGFDFSINKKTKDMQVNWVAFP